MIFYVELAVKQALRPQLFTNCQHRLTRLDRILLLSYQDKQGSSRNKLRRIFEDSEKTLRVCHIVDRLPVNASTSISLTTPLSCIFTAHLFMTSISLEIPKKGYTFG